MNTNCMRCGDNRVVYEKKDRFNRKQAEPCPECNKNGQTVAKELGSIERRRKDGFN